jgi:hypothetical protein
MRLSERFGIVPIIEPEDHQSAGIDGDSVKLEQYGHVTFIFIFGELAGNSDLIIYEGATAGAKTTALTFSYRYTGADLKNDDADQFGSESTSSELELTNTTFEDRMLVVEIDASELTDGYPWVTPSIDSDATELLVACVAIMGKPRYAEDVPPTAIA